MAARVQTEPFDVSREIALLHGHNAAVGAIAVFIGTVRELQGATMRSLTLEHYPGMTEAALDDIIEKARARFRLIDCTIVHRVGELRVLDAIVLVAVSAQHRKAAFEACEFVMDFLKTQAPFWKKEMTDQGSSWVEARASDDTAAARWGESHE